MYILGRIVRIRGIEKADLPLLFDMINSPEVETTTVGDHLPVSMFEEEQWFLANKTDGRIQRFIVETPKSGAVGMVSYDNIDWKNRIFETSIKLNVAKIHEPGVGIDAHMAMLRYGFDQMQMNRATGHVLDYNRASINMQKACGYKVEGVQRQAIYKDGKYHDLILTGLLRSEYYELIDREKYWDNNDESL